MLTWGASPLRMFVSDTGRIEKFSRDLRLRWARNKLVVVVVFVVIVFVVIVFVVVVFVVVTNSSFVFFVFFASSFYLCRTFCNRIFPSTWLE